MRVSLREVARKAGVSDATVSRVLNGVDARITPSTQQRVRHIAAEMGYQPHRAARALATGRTQTLALWLSDLRAAYYAEAIYHARQEVQRHHYDLLISETVSSLDVSKLSLWPVDGIMAVDTGGHDIPGLVNSLLHHKPFVSMGGFCHPLADFVAVDFYAQAVVAVRHLSAIGCRRIVYLVPDYFHAIGDARQDGYRAALQTVGQTPEYITTVGLEAQRVAAREAVRGFIEQQGCPDGLFCFNDDLAIGAYSMLREMGLRIPQDVALIGCDGIDDTRYHDPPLSTIAQPLAEMSARAWQFLEQRIANPDHPLQQVSVQPTLELRGSALR